MVKKKPADEPAVRFDSVMFKPTRTNYTFVCRFGSKNRSRGSNLYAGSIFPLMSVL